MVLAINSKEEQIIYDLAKQKQIHINKKIKGVNTVIVDFFNIYCSIIKFDKYKIFSRETYILCIDLLLKKFKHNKLIIVSKNIFEIEIEYIHKLTLNNPNLEYIIVEDAYHIKSQNRERDDYTCFLLYNLLEQQKYKPLILSNDKFRNFKEIITVIKPFILFIYKDGNLQYNIHIDTNKIHENYNKLLTLYEETNSNRSGSCMSWRHCNSPIEKYLHVATYNFLIR